MCRILPSDFFWITFLNEVNQAASFVFSENFLLNDCARMIGIFTLKLFRNIIYMVKLLDFLVFVVRNLFSVGLPKLV